jgi:Fe-S-cluster containining protein
MNISDEILTRAKDLITNNVPQVCGQGCPMFCCDPVTAVHFMPKHVFNEAEKYETVILRVQAHIDKFIEKESANGERCFSLKYVYVGDIIGDFAGMSDQQIRSNIVEQRNQYFSTQEMNDLVLKIKKKLREEQLQILMGFDCIYLDKEKNLCSNYQNRPGMCKVFSCFQLDNEYSKKDKKVLIEQLTIKKQQREDLKQSGSDIFQAIQSYFDRKNFK